MVIAGNAKQGLADEEAVAWFHRALEINRNLPIAYFYLAAALAQLGRLDEAQAANQAGLALIPTFTIARWRRSAPSDNPTILAQRERICDGMRKAGVPEGRADFPIGVKCGGCKTLAARPLFIQLQTSPCSPRYCSASVLQP
jgi:tetratricopeptide (TPR) repeat protein